MPNYKNLSDRGSVLNAITEYDQLGQQAFLKRYGFGKARTFVMIHNGRQYDSKAIVGAAYGHQFGKPLLATDFSGGQVTVVPLLMGLGFEVVALGLDDNTVALSEEVPNSMWEGAKRTVSVNAYERSAAARAKCIETHGSACAICEFKFGQFYGKEFYGFIHIHHKTPVSQVGTRYEVDPEKDLVPLCPNCHAIIHYGNKTRTVDEVKALILKSKQQNRTSAKEPDACE